MSILCVCLSVHSNGVLQSYCAFHSRDFKVMGKVDDGVIRKKMGLGVWDIGSGSYRVR